MSNEITDRIKRINNFSKACDIMIDNENAKLLNSWKNGFIIKQKKVVYSSKDEYEKLSKNFCDNILNKWKFILNDINPISNNFSLDRRTNKGGRRIIINEELSKLTKGEVDDWCSKVTNIVSNSLCELDRMLSNYLKPDKLKWLIYNITTNIVIYGRESEQLHDYCNNNGLISEVKQFECPKCKNFVVDLCFPEFCSSYRCYDCEKNLPLDLDV
tara:strand:- start:177 stop:818 length:642 start_codon:yes stop_codon:yes gene_type:complete